MAGTFVGGTTSFASVPYRELTVIAGFATATWEVTAPVATATESYTFPIVVENAMADQITQIRTLLRAGLAPLNSTIFSVPTIPVPRYADARLKSVDLRIFPSAQSRSAQSRARASRPLGRMSGSPTRSSTTAMKQLRRSSSEAMRQSATRLRIALVPMAESAR